MRSHRCEAGTAGSVLTSRFPRFTSIEDAYLTISQQLKAEDLSFNWMDAVQPEYYLSDNEIFLDDKSGPAKVAKAALILFSVWVGLTLAHKLFLHYRVVDQLTTEIRACGLGAR